MLRTNMAWMMAKGEPNPEEFVMEYQVEHERGFLLFGASRFSANALFPLDPSHFTTRANEPLGSRLLDMEVPDDSWVWVWSRWYVDMTSNVDDQGWRYSWRFGSKHWSDRHKFGRAFVRQRQWVRPRAKRSLIEDFTRQSVSSNSSERNLKEEDEAQESRILNYFKTCRNDRETVNAIVSYLTEHEDELPVLMRLKESIESLLVFDISRNTLHEKLAKSNSGACQRFLLAPSTIWREQVLLHGEPNADTKEPLEDKDEQATPSPEEVAEEMTE